MNATAMRTIRTTPADSGIERNRPSGMRGCATFVSQKENTAKSATDTTTNTHVLPSPQPHAGALMSAQTRQNIAPESSAMPRMSKDRPSPCPSSGFPPRAARWSRRISMPRARASPPTGTLTKNTDCQSTCSTRTPPRIGPPAVDAPITMPQIPMAMLSCSAGKVARSRPSAAGISSAPNRPWKTRKVTTAAMLWDRPMAPEAEAKPVTPMRKVCRWPKRSPSLPAVIRETARARK